ncbi:MAG TPA: NAD(P)H-hydrate dehydratase, partial [Rubrivivax sp.]|nr:NAD(P)H-hydrate dehydratase [Rubrivivax sp.]
APHAQRVRVWAGPGNNGGDGLVAARHLHQAGRTVCVTLLAEPVRLPGDAARALEEAQAAGVAIDAGAIDTWASDLAIDALLGIGARRAPQGAIAAAIDAMQAQQAQVLAVDLPSGLHPDTGALLGHTAVRAAATLALLTIKPGCCTGHGRDHAGDLWLDTLGVAADEPSAWLSGPPARPHRPHAAHKGSFGAVAVVGGAPGRVGAAWLAARAALAAGAGRVYCSLLDEGAAALDPMRPELMSRRAWWRSTPAVLAQTTVVCGCGGGDAVRAVLPPLLSQAARLVLDADALNALASEPTLRILLRARAARGLATLLTPHPLEAARLLQASSAQVQGDRLAAARQLVADTGAAVLLKGSGSIVAAPNRSPRINPTGNAALASAGTGDVLAGWAAGLWAQQPQARAADVAAAAAWQHGRAADLHVAACGSAALCAADLVEALARLPAA